MDYSTLNAPQRQVVETLKGPLLVLAGAGTGKTKAITMRMAHMVSLGIAPESIAAMTFTNKAAREMAERLRQLIGPKLASRLHMGTFHGFCLKILKEYGTRINIPKKFSLAGTSDQIDLLRRAVQELETPLTVNVDQLHSEISRAKNALMSAQEFGCHGMHLNLGVDPDLLEKIFELYERQLHLNRMIDFDDCIAKTVKLLESSSEVCFQLQNKYRYFLVDEFQDTNFAQLRVLELLGKSHRNVCVVGDDDQSIYSWRGAMYETLEKFEEIFPGTLLIKLEQNYRCTNLILEAANTVIKNNTKRKDKTLWSANDTSWPIDLQALSNEEEEARYIADKCLTFQGQGYQHSDIAILYRSNQQARPIELALKELGIPYETFGGSSFFERKEVRDFLSYIRLLIRPDDRLAFYRVVNTPHRGIGLKSLERIEEFSKKSGASPWHVAKMNGSELELSSRPFEALKQFLEQIESFRKWHLKTPEDLAALGHELIKTFQLASDIRAHVKDPASQERKIEALKSLPGWLATCARDSFRETGSLDLPELLDRLTLNDRDFSDRDDAEKKNRVSLMTVHAAKGLEFPAVFVCGLEEDLFPHKNSRSFQGLMEERRLFYVALTRAKHKLVITWCRERGQGTMKTSRAPSRFLSEIPEGCLNGSLTQSSWAEETQNRQTKTVGALQALKLSLGGKTGTTQPTGRSIS